MSYVIYVWYQIQFEILIHACSKLLFLRFEVKEENKNSINQYLQWLKEKKLKNRSYKEQWREFQTKV